MASTARFCVFKVFSHVFFMGKKKFAAKALSMTNADYGFLPEDIEAELEKELERRLLKRLKHRRG